MKSVKLQQLRESYESYKNINESTYGEEADGMTFPAFVIRESENDSQFFSWLFDDGEIEGIEDLNTEQLDEWKDLIGVDKNSVILYFEEGDFYTIVDESDIHYDEPLHDGWTGCRHLTPAEAGDYSLLNSDSGAEDDMIEEGAKIFGDKFEDVCFEEADGRFYVVNCVELELSEKENEMNEFINNWESEKAEAATGTYFNRWDGHNLETVQIGSDFGVTVCSARKSAEILRVYNQAKFEENGLGSYIAKVGPYELVRSQWEEDYWLEIRVKS